MFDNSKIRMYKWPEFHYIELTNKVTIDSFRLMDISNESIQETKKKDFLKALEDDVVFNVLNGSAQANYFSSNYDYTQLTMEGLVKYQQYATILTIYSFIENQLRTLCDILSNNYKLTLKLSSTKSKIQNYYDFLKENLKLNTETIDQYFNSINNIRVIRNSIAHSSDDVTTNERNQVFTTTNAENKTSISRELIKSLLTETGIFLNDLLVLIDDKIQKV